MTDTSQAHKKSSFERNSRGFWRGNWPVLVIGSLAVLCTLAALAWWWLLPAYVQRVVVEMEESLGRIGGTQVSHETVTLEGLSHLRVTGVVLGEETAPLVRLDQVALEFDPFAFTQGLPTVLQVTAAGVRVRAERYANGNDNFRHILASVAEYLERERTGGGKPGKLARLLRQTPAIELQGVDVVVALEEPQEEGGWNEVLRLQDGTIRAENPNLSLKERAYRLDGWFAKANGGARATLAADVDISHRIVQLQAEFSPSLYVAARGQEMEVHQVRYRSGEFVEVQLGRIRVANPVVHLDLVRNLLGSDSPEVDEPGVAERPGVPDVGALFDDVAGQVIPRLGALRYPPAVWKRYASSLKRLVVKLAARILSEAEGDYVVLDSARVLYLVKSTRAGAPVRKLKVSLKAGKHGTGEFSLSHNVESDLYKASYDVVSPSRLFELSGELEKEGDRLEARTDVSASITDPVLQVRGTLGYRNGQWEGDFRGQVKSSQPPIALSANLVAREGRITGDVEGELLVPDVFFARRVKAILQHDEWSVDVNGLLYPPTGGAAVEVQAALDSRSGVKRFTASSEEDLRFNVGEWDVLLSRARMGRDSVLHFEDLAVTRRGADRTRAVVRVSDLGLILTRKGLDLINAVRELDWNARPESLLGSLVSSVEVVEPVMVLRQPPRLTSVEDEAAEAADMTDRIADQLEEESTEAAVMHEPIRHALQGLVVGTGTAVQAFINTMLKLGDRFPLERVEIKEGKFEYADAVSPQDRLLSELSDFNASITKVRRAGNLGGKFSIEAGFSTAVANRDADSSLKAEVDLATGNLRGELTVEKMALFPYRFFLPALVSPTKVTFLEDTAAGFSYTTETDRFRVWGKGRITDFNLVSRRLSSRPVEHMTVDFLLGSDDASGLVFELERRRLGTTSPLLFSFGKVSGLALEFAVDASTPDFPTFELKLKMPRVPFGDLLASLPRGLREDMAGLELSGALGLEMELTGNSKDLRDLKYRFVTEESDVRVESPGHSVDFNKLAGEFKHRPHTAPERTVFVGTGEKYVTLDQISPWLVLAVTTCEDGSYFRHEGFNTYQIKMSIIRNLEAGRFVRGASTITMQLVKNLFLTHQKNVARKFQEIILTWLIEKEIRKDKMLEIYLNIIEWGDGIYGIREACDYYFDGLPPANLSPAQAAFLASFIPYPRPFMQRFAKGMHGAERSKRWLRWWDRRRRIVKRIVRAMVNNCHKIDSKCPSTQPYCRILQATCEDPGRELVAADNVENLDELFRPRVEPEAAPAPEVSEEL